MLKLLMGITLSEAGGSQRVVFDIIANLPEDLYDITLVTAPGGELIDWVNEQNVSRANKIKIITLPHIRRGISPFHDVRVMASMLRVLRTGKYDIAHFHNSKMGIIGRIAARVLRVPKICYTVHGWGLSPTTTGSMYGIMSWIERLTVRCRAETIFVCESDRKVGICNRWADAAKSRLIYNGISAQCGSWAGLRRNLGIPDARPVIVFAARLAEPKMPLFAIKSAQCLRSKGLDFLLLIVGDGPMMVECKNLVDSLGIKEHVFLLGKRHDVRAILKEADIFCLFSEREGLPISIIEAMFAGLPIVASAVGGVPELVEHGQTGYLLHGFDTAEASEILGSLIRVKDTRLRLGRAGLDAANSKFELEGMVSKYRQLYEGQ